MPEIVKRPTIKRIIHHESEREIWEEDYDMILDCLERHDRGEIELDEQFIAEERARLEDLKQKLNIK